MKKITPFLIAGFVLLLPGCIEHTVDLDLCPEDALKDDPGVCGCGVADTDTDLDGTLDCLDFCKEDPDKIEPGTCGCGTSDEDTDGNNVPDCLDEGIDMCPEDPDKTMPGVCGCGTPDVDADGDGAYICHDECDDDPKKTKAGICGCGVSDADSDGDGTPDCQEECDLNPSKTEPGVCGCELSDADSDGDGTLDCLDLCPQDAEKTDVGICGCGLPDDGKSIDDDDGDGVINCMDLCPDNPIKSTPGKNGCKANDSDDDGIEDTDDICPNNPNKSKVEDGNCNYNDDGVFEIWSTEDLVRLEVELQAQTMPAHRPGLPCFKVDEMRCESAGTSATYSVCSDTDGTGTLKHVEKQCDEGYVCGLDGTDYKCIPKTTTELPACTELTDPPQAGNCCDAVWTPVCAEGKLMSCASDRLEETACEFGCADEMTCNTCRSAETPEQIGDCCAAEWTATCTNGKRLSCVSGKLEENACEFGCAEDATCNTCRPAETPAQIDDCCTDENYSSKCDGSGMMACVDGRVTRVECLGTCQASSEESQAVTCQMTTDKETTYFKAKVMRDLDLGEQIACHYVLGDYYVGNWPQIDLSRVILDGNEKTITFKHENGKRCAMTRPLFNNVVESHIYKLNLDFDVRGASEGAFAHYIDHSQIHTIGWKGALISGSPLYGESNPKGIGMIATQAENSAFADISMTGSLSLTSSNYYGLIAHMSNTKVNHANIELNKVEIDNTNNQLHVAGAFGGLGANSVLSNITVNITDIDIPENATPTIAGLFDSIIDSQEAGSVAIDTAKVTITDTDTAPLKTAANISGLGYKVPRLEKLSDVTVSIKNINTSEAIYGITKEMPSGNVVKANITLENIQSDGNIYGLTENIQIPMSDIAVNMKQIKTQDKIYGLAYQIKNHISNTEVSIQDASQMNHIYGLSHTITNKSNISDTTITMNNVHTKSNFYGLADYIGGKVYKTNMTLNQIQSDDQVFGLSYQITETGSVDYLRIDADDVISNQNIYFIVNDIKTPNHDTLTIHNANVYFINTHTNNMAFAIHNIESKVDLKNIAVYADAYVKKQNKNSDKSSLIHTVNLKDTKITHIASSINLKRYENYSIDANNNTYTYNHITENDRPMVINQHKEYINFDLNIYWLKRKDSDKALLFGEYNNLLPPFSTTQGKKIVETLNGDEPGVTWITKSVTENSDSFEIPWIAD